MKKIITVGVVSLVVVSVVVGVYFWYTMGKPLYEPGMVRTAKNLRAPLKPPAQTKETGFWQVEPDIKLKHFSAGDGKNIFSKSEDDLIKLNQGFIKYYMAVTKFTIPEQGVPGGWMVHAMFFSMGKKHDYRHALKKVNAPVMVIHAADDLQSEAASRLYADTFPNASFEIIQNSGHFPFHEQPVKFAQVVGQFLNSLD